MRRISVIAALIAGPIGIVGVYGLSFDHMPELRRIYDYLLAIGAVIVLRAAIYRAFRRNDWL
jgi:magnesium transporter